MTSYILQPCLKKLAQCHFGNRLLYQIWLTYIELPIAIGTFQIIYSLNSFVEMDFKSLKNKCFSANMPKKIRPAGRTFLFYLISIRLSCFIAKKTTHFRPDSMLNNWEKNDFFHFFYKKFLIGVFWLGLAGYRKPTFFYFLPYKAKKELVPNYMVILWYQKLSFE